MPLKNNCSHYTSVLCFCTLQLLHFWQIFKRLYISIFNIKGFDFFWQRRNSSKLQSFQFFLIDLFILFLAALGLRCCTWAFSSCGEQGLLFIVVCGLLIAVASLAVEHRLQARRLQQLWHVGSVVVARRVQSAGSVVVAHGLS